MALARNTSADTVSNPVVQAALGFEADAVQLEDASRRSGGGGDSRASSPAAAESLAELETLALSENPSLHRLRHLARAAYAKAAYADKLPDPAFGSNVFTSPIETAAGAQTANLSVTQLIPWLQRLDAAERKECLEALAARQEVEVERLRVLAEVRAVWYRLFVIGKQLETNRASEQLLETLIELANARVAQGQATQGDVLLGTIELAKLRDQRLQLEESLESAKASLNRLVGRESGAAIVPPREIDAALPDWSPDELFAVALSRQPAIEAGRLRAAAARWGIRVARLRRRPDVTLNATWFAIDDNRPRPNIVDVGEDAFSLGASLTLPIWRSDYDAILSEAQDRRRASQAEVQSLRQRYDALIRDLWAQARSAQQSADLFANTILPQAERSLEADQQSYAADAADFDRLIEDYRNLLTIELQYHQAVGRLATAIARIRQAVGVDLESR